jgi:hypothetical protein
MFLLAVNKILFTFATRKNPNKRNKIWQHTNRQKNE